jgi:hypothetical protein
MLDGFIEQAQAGLFDGLSADQVSHLLSVRPGTVPLI